MGSDGSNLYTTASQPTTLAGAPVLDPQHEEAWGDGPGYGVVAAFSIGGGHLVDSVYQQLDGISMW
jgi:hypothetical protein